MARDADGLSGLWADAAPLQRAEVMRMRDQHGVYAHALYEAVAERMREAGGLALHDQVEAEVVRRLAVAAQTVGGAIPEPVLVSPEGIRVRQDWATDPQILKMFGELAFPSGYTDAGVPPEGQRRGWRPPDA